MTDNRKRPVRKSRVIGIGYNHAASSNHPRWNDREWQKIYFPARRAGASHDEAKAKADAARGYK